MIDDNSPPNTAYNFHRTVLSEEQLYLKGVELKFSRSLKYLTTQELRNLFRPTTLMSCYPSPTLLANFSKQLMICSSLWSVCDPWCLGHPWGDLVVPTGWKLWGRFMAFCSSRSKSQREIVHQAVRKGQLDSLSRVLKSGGAAYSNYHLCTISIRSNQLPILPFLHFLTVR